MKIRLGPWEPLPGAGGQALAIAGATLAATSETALVVWRDGREIAAHASPRRLPGRPRLAGDRVHWGDGGLDLVRGTWMPVPGLATLLATTPSASEVATAWAWAADGRQLAVCIAGAADGSVRFVAINAADGAVTPLWRAGDVPPRSAWIGGERIVLGSRVPQTWLRDGQPAGALDDQAGLPALRIEASADERRLLLTTPACLTLYRLPGPGVHGRWPGDWKDAALAPDGRALFALDAAGRLHVAQVDGDAMLHRLGPAPEGISALSCDGTQLLVAAGPRQRWYRARYAALS